MCCLKLLHSVTRMVLDLSMLLLMNWTRVHVIAFRHIARLLLVWGALLNTHHRDRSTLPTIGSSCCCWGRRWLVGLGFRRRDWFVWGSFGWRDRLVVSVPVPLLLVNNSVGYRRWGCTVFWTGGRFVAIHPVCGRGVCVKRSSGLTGSVSGVLRHGTALTGSGTLTGWVVVPGGSSHRTGSAVATRTYTQKNIC